MELTGGDAFDDDLLDRLLPREIELLRDVAQLAAAHRLTPRVDPEQPARLALARRVQLEDALELLGRGIALGDRRRQASEVGLGRKAESLREQCPLRLEVVMDQPTRHIELVARRRRCACSQTLARSRPCRWLRGSHGVVRRRWDEALAARYLVRRRAVVIRRRCSADLHVRSRRAGFSPPSLSRPRGMTVLNCDDSSRTPRPTPSARSRSSLDR